MTSAPTVAARGTTGLPVPDHDLFYLDQNSQVIQRVVADGVPGPEYNLGAVLYPGSTVAALWSADGDRLDLFGRGTESALWQKSFTWSSGWGAWTARTGAGTLTSDPSVTSMRSGSLDVFFRGVGHDLQHVRIIDGQVTSAVSLGGNLSTGPAAITTGGITRVVSGQHVTGFEPGVWVEHSPYDGKGWARNVIGDPQRYMTAAPALFSPASGKVDVALRNADSGLNWTRRISHFEETTAPSPAGSAPAIVTTPDGDGVVYLRGQDNRLVALGLGPR